MGIHNLHINGRLFNATMRKVISKLAHEEVAKNAKDDWIPEWPTTTKVRSGAVLAVVFIQLAKVKVPHPDPNEENAFQHGYTYIKGKKTGIICMKWRRPWKWALR
ncbi:UNVERIFIED_CONTAM: hypothetical protein HDU68_004797 [Siphonaria sp. JEL0065]|nr:hypothetical protein HDU68_004797 [Siphonaria sp. JEL0065]